MVCVSSKSEVFDFSGGQKPPIRGLTIIERSWNYGNLPYLVANTYGLNFIKIGGISIFPGGGWGGGETLIRVVTCGLWHPFSNSAELFQSKVMWKIWFGLVEIGGMLSLRGAEDPLLGGVTCDLRCPSSNLAELFQSKVMCENLVRIGWAFQELSCPQTNIQKKKKKKAKSQMRLKTKSLEKFFSGG